MVRSIGQAAFEGCSALESIKIPSSLTTIENRLFFGCHALKHIDIPDSVTSIGEAAFDSCTAMEVTAPAEKKKKLPFWGFEDLGL